MVQEVLAQPMSFRQGYRLGFVSRPVRWGQKRLKCAMMAGCHEVVVASYAGGKLAGDQEDSDEGMSEQDVVQHKNLQQGLEEASCFLL